MPTNGQSQVVTLVFTDLEGSTALKTARGDAAIADLIARHRDHVSKLADGHGGHVIDWAGDGCFLTFDSSSGAVTFSLRLQQIHHYESDLPSVRVGVHMGEVTVRAASGTTQVEGLAVDLAARISALAQPAQVLVSAAVQQSAKQRLGIHEFGQPVRWEDYGPYELKGFDENIDIREAGLDGISSFLKPPVSEKARPAGGAETKRGVASDGDTPIRKMAVLPLTNLSGDPSQEFFVDAMTDAVITELAKIKALRVISRTSVMRYKNTTASVADIAAELGVDALIEGSVLRAGDDVRITAQLIRTDSDEHVWAEQYDGTVDNILKLQKDIALTIADAIQVAVTADERARLRHAERIAPEAYDLFLKAASFGRTWTPASIRESLDQFDEVQRIAPAFSRVHTLKATAYFFMGLWGFAQPAACFSASRRMARKALRANEYDDGAHTVLAWLAMAYEWDWDEARQRFNRALELQTSNQFIYTGLAFFTAILGDLKEAERNALRAIEVDPNNAATHHNLGLMKFYSRDDEAAKAKVREALELNAKALPCYTDGSLMAAFVGDHESARALIDKGIALAGEQPHLLAYKAYAHARAGEIEAAERLLAAVEPFIRRMKLLFTDLALVNAALDRMDLALEALERAHREREYLIATIPVNPVFDPFRGEARFEAMLRELNIDGRDEFLITGHRSSLALP